MEKRAVLSKNITVQQAFLACHLARYKLPFPQTPSILLSLWTIDGAGLLYMNKERNIRFLLVSNPCILL